MDELVGLLDLFEPPPGWVFSSGILVTHDLATTVVADHVLPALTGVGALETRRRRELARAEFARLGASLTVLGCQGRIACGAATPGVMVVPVGGRRLHAKFWLLQFRPEQPENSTKRRTRAVVTSANLTSGGLLRHREVVAWEENGHTTKTALAADLLGPLRQLANGLPDPYAKALRAAIKAIRKGLAPDVELAGGVHTSGFAALGSPCLATAKPRRPVDRVVIVTPPFASDQDAQAIAALRHLLDDSPVVDLYTGLPPGTPTTSAGLPQLTFSTRVLRDLQSVASGVMVHGIPELVDDADGPVLRRLHAKLIAAVSGTSVDLWLGSANLTARGLGGRNRELMLERTWTLAALDEFLAGLDAVPVDMSVPPLAPQVEFTEDPPPGLDLQAQFWVGPGQSSTARLWDGDLYLLDEVPPGATVEYEGQPIKNDYVQPFQLFEGRARLEVVQGNRRTTLPIAVFSEDVNFWEVGPDDRPPPRPQRIDEFLTDLRTIAARTVSRMDGTPLPPGGADTAFRLPIEQRLVMVARARHLLHLFPAGALVEHLDEYLGGGSGQPADIDRQRQIGAVLAAHATGSPASPDDELVAALAQLLVTLDTTDVGA